MKTWRVEFQAKHPLYVESQRSTCVVEAESEYAAKLAAIDKLYEDDDCIEDILPLRAEVISK